MLEAAGGDRVENFEGLQEDPGLVEMLGQDVPSPAAKVKSSVSLSRGSRDRERAAGIASGTGEPTSLRRMDHCAVWRR